MRANTAAFGYGGGLCSCDGEILNCTITDNTSKRAGGGLCYCDADINCCTIIGNSVTGEGRYDGGGGGLSSCQGAISNCIIWGNTAKYDQNLSEYYTPSFCCIESWRGGGEGNILDDPAFVYGPFGGYYLSSEMAGQERDSSCIDAGTGTAADHGLAGLTTTADNAPDIGAVDIGYHYSRVRMSLKCSLNWDRFEFGERIRGYLSFANEGAGAMVDACVVLIAPDEAVFSLGEGGFALGMQFWLSNVFVPEGFGFDDAPAFELIVPESALPGLYAYAVHVGPAFTPSTVLASAALFMIED